MPHVFWCARREVGVSTSFRTNSKNKMVMCHNLTIVGMALMLLTLDFYRKLACQRQLGTCMILMKL